MIVLMFIIFTDGCSNFIRVGFYSICKTVNNPSIMKCLGLFGFVVYQLFRHPVLTGLCVCFEARVNVS